MIVTSKLKEDIALASVTITIKGYPLCYGNAVPEQNLC